MDRYIHTYPYIYMRVVLPTNSYVSFPCPCSPSRSRSRSRPPSSSFDFSRSRSVGYRSLTLLLSRSLAHSLSLFLTLSLSLSPFTYTHTHMLLAHFMSLSSSPFLLSFSDSRSKSTDDSKRRRVYLRCFLFWTRRGCHSSHAGGIHSYHHIFLNQTPIIKKGSFRLRCHLCSYVNQVDVLFNVLQRVAAYRSVSQCVAACCIVQAIHTCEAAGSSIVHEAARCISLSPKIPGSLVLKTST